MGSHYQSIGQIRCLSKMYLSTVSRVLIAVALLLDAGVDSSPIDTFEDLIDIIKTEDKEGVIKERSLNNEASNHDNSVDRISEIENIKEADNKSSDVAKITDTYSVAQDRTLLQAFLFNQAINIKHPEKKPEPVEYKIVRCFHVPKIVSCTKHDDEVSPWQECETTTDRECYLFTYA